MIEELKTTLPTAEADKILNVKPKDPTDDEIMLDYAYYKAQEICEALYSSGLISLDELHKITKRNRETFSPMYAEIISQIT
ncbi:MAG: SHOCT domain-containing protein [Eggerthia catenaformis]|uniref:SHOCT domain-containing protein n=1 Tax=Eggerthia catenaformis TaxID=31973 RepID=UPI003FA10373